MLLVSATSLASTDEPTAPVSGTVTVNGQPIETGKIIFSLEDDEFMGAKIKDGKYHIKRLPAGTWRVAIQSKSAPKKYGEEDTSPLTVKIQGGVSNTIDFDLKD